MMSEHRPKYPRIGQTFINTPRESTQRDRRPATSLLRLLIGPDVGLMSRHYLLIGPENTLLTLGVLIWTIALGCLCLCPDEYLFVTATFKCCRVYECSVNGWCTYAFISYFLYFESTCWQAAHDFCCEPSTEYSSGQLQCSTHGQMLRQHSSSVGYEWLGGC